MKMKPTVIILHPVDAPIHEVATEILRDVANVEEIQTERRDLVDKRLLKKIRGADAILVRFCMVTKDLIEIAKRLKIIAVHGVGVDNVDIDAATRRGIVVTSAPLSNLVSVAEFTLGLIISLTRRIPTISELTKDGEWVQARSIEPGVELSGKILGIIGLGNIGIKVAEKARAFEMRILAFDPYISKERAEEFGAKLVDMETLLRESDVITLHVPLTPETRHMISEREFRLMKKTAILINASRGGVVDETSLYRALKEGWIAGAALDVMEKEPLSPDNPLLTLDNVIITPHVAGSTKESLVRMATTPAEDIVRFLQGKAPRFPVNVEFLSALKEKRVISRGRESFLT